jgi:hypothetical protein
MGRLLAQVGTVRMAKGVVYAGANLHSANDLTSYKTPTERTSWMRCRIAFAILHCTLTFTLRCRSD